MGGMVFGVLCDKMWLNAILSLKIAFWNVVYPHVVMEEKKNHYILTNENYIDIILFLETSGFSYL